MQRVYVKIGDVGELGTHGKISQSIRKLPCVSQASASAAAQRYMYAPSSVVRPPTLLMAQNISRWGPKGVSRVTVIVVV